MWLDMSFQGEPMRQYQVDANILKIIYRPAGTAGIRDAILLDLMGTACMLLCSGLPLNVRLQWLNATLFRLT